MNIPSQRLFNQAISQPRFATAGEVVQWMGAMQAQDYTQAVWAVGLRMQNGTLAAVEAALARAQIVRTWVMRGTIHFAPPQDVRWMLKLAAARILARDQRRLAQLELSVDDMARCADLLRGILAGGRVLPRAAVLAALEQAGISTQKQRGYHILWYAGQAGVICMGPMQDKQQTFVLLDDWVAAGRTLSTEEALAELAQRYANSHAPATAQDLAWWAGISVGEARRGFADAGLASEKIDGITYYLGQNPAPTQPNTASYLLPGYDEYLLGYKERGAVISPDHARRVVPGGNGVFYPIIVQNGQVVGTWKRALKKKGIEITLDPFLPLAEQPPAAAYRAFWGEAG